MTQRQSRYKVGHTIDGRYLVHQVHMGGMGEVYLCLDTQHNVPIALKTFQGNAPHLRTRFDKEVKKWIALEKHPNIVSCLWMIDVDAVPFLFLEWIIGDKRYGTDLRAWLRYGALDLKQTLKFAIDIVRGLVYAGEKSVGIVHCDLKPDNILISETGMAKITDFGLAIIKSEASDEGIIVGGTYAYMPPEQWRSDVIKIDSRTDIYAVGCIIYEMLTGRMVYYGTRQELLRQHQEAPIPQIPHIPLSVNHIITKCLAKNYEDRYATPQALLNDLIVAYETHVKLKLLPEVRLSYNAVDYNNRGKTYAYLQMYELAIADFSRALALNPQDGMAHMSLATTYDHLGDTKKAMVEYDKAIRIVPDAPMIYYNRGLTHFHARKYRKAMADFTHAIHLDKNFVDAYVNRSQCHAQLNQHRQAIGDCDMAIRLDPKEANAYYNRANSYLDLGHYQHAISDYTKAIECDNQNPDFYFNRADVYAKTGDYLRAIQDFDNILSQLNPEDSFALMNKAICLAQMGNYDEALTCLEKAHRLGHPQALSALIEFRQIINNIRGE